MLDAVKVAHAHSCKSVSCPASEPDGVPDGAAQSFNPITNDQCCRLQKVVEQITAHGLDTDGVCPCPPNDNKYQQNAGTLGTMETTKLDAPRCHRFGMS